MYSQTQYNHDKNCRSGASNSQWNGTLIGTKGHHDKSNLQALKQYTLECHGERIPVIYNYTFVARFPRFTSIGSSFREDRSFIMQGLEPTGPENSLSQPLQTEYQ